jgi:hypothetical protein
MTTTAEGVETSQQQKLLRARLLGNAGLSVQRAKAGSRDRGIAVRAPARPDGGVFGPQAPSGQGFLIL